MGILEVLRAATPAGETLESQESASGVLRDATKPAAPHQEETADS